MSDTKRMAVTLDFDVPATMNPRQCRDYLYAQAKAAMPGVKITKALVHKNGTVIQDLF